MPKPDETSMIEPAIENTWNTRPVTKPSTMPTAAFTATMLISSAMPGSPSIGRARNRAPATAKARRPGSGMRRASTGEATTKVASRVIAATNPTAQAAFSVSSAPTRDQTISGILVQRTSTQSVN